MVFDDRCGGSVTKEATHAIHHERRVRALPLAVYEKWTMFLAAGISRRRLEEMLEYYTKKKNRVRLSVKYCKSGCKGEED
jgi:hypothetical protein